MYVDIATGTPYSESRRAWAIGSSAIVRGYSLTPPAGDWYVHRCLSALARACSGGRGGESRTGWEAPIWWVVAVVVMVR